MSFPSAQTVKNMPAMKETQAQSLGQEDPQEKGMATHSSILAWRIPWTEQPKSWTRLSPSQKLEDYEGQCRGELSANFILNSGKGKNII